MAIPRLTALLATALALALFGMAFHQQRAARFKAEAAKTAQIALTLRAALDAQNLVAEECSNATEELLAIQAAYQSRVVEAVTLAKQYRDQLAATREALRIQQETDRAIPECQAVLDTDLSVCPGYARGVRLRASGVQGQGDKDTSSGTR
jgi:uncharacterized protein HemX